MKKILNWFSCYIFNWHSWTCRANEGIAPTETEMTANGWRWYSKMYCKHCGKESELNTRL